MNRYRALQTTTIDMNAMMSLMVTMMIMVMMMRMMGRALEPSKEHHSLPAIKPPPGYVPVGTTRGAPRITEEEELQGKKLSLENTGREIASAASVEFLRLDEGWEAEYSTPRYWFKDAAGRECIATDLEELKWKIPFMK